jgi:polyphenol oxidase
MGSMELGLEWSWVEWQGLPYLRCGLLAGWDHGFFTQQCWPRTPVDLATALRPGAPVYRTHQVHGNRVFGVAELAPIDAEAGRDGLSQGDGSVTIVAGQSVWACSADCTPALIADRGTGQVAAVHAGWRGTSLRIVPVAIERLLAQGSRLEDLVVAMGPAIDGSVYQVAESVAAEVGASVLPDLEPAARLVALAKLERSPILPDDKPGHVRLDVRRVNELQLLGLGLVPEQISIAPICTYQDPVNFFSYRRNPEKKVQWSGIVSR